MEVDEITGLVVDAAVRIHRELGPGLLESVYEGVLANALRRRGLHVDRQLPVSFSYDGIQFDQGFRIDLLVEGCVVIEIKSIERTAPAHSKQVLTYLRLSNLTVGLLLNFGAGTMKEGLRRVVNDLSSSSASPREPHSVIAFTPQSRTTANAATRIVNLRVSLNWRPHPTTEAVVAADGQERQRKFEADGHFDDRDPLSVSALRQHTRMR